ncbi:MAG: nitrilase-related carbon-nitrogen hydrolase [Bacillota bacterium]|nr:nitrilase-related carbon-nitrogen hydrolase [Bacillota bacterium]
MILEVMALSLSDASFSSPLEYEDSVERIAGEVQMRADLAVLPAYSALLFAWNCSMIKKVSGFREAVLSYLDNCEEVNGEFLNSHIKLAKNLNLCIISGTTLEREGRKIYHTSTALDRKGKVLGKQRQTHLSALEQGLGICRGNELQVFNTDLGRIGIVVGNDAWYPEVSRILALQGAEIICHPGALDTDHSSSWRQLSGMWREVQQNQFFCVESQLTARIGGESFSAQSAVHAPCEMTEGKSGYLALGKTGQEWVSAHLDFTAREKVIQNYPLLSFLNREAYRHYFPQIYASIQKQEVK